MTLTCPRQLLNISAMLCGIYSGMAFAGCGGADIGDPLPNSADGLWINDVSTNRSFLSRWTQSLCQPSALDDFTLSTNHVSDNHPHTVSGRQYELLLRRAITRDGGTFKNLTAVVQPMESGIEGNKLFVDLGTEQASLIWQWNF